MNRLFKKVVATTLAAALTLGSVFTMASCGKKNYAADNTTIKIGVSGPLSGAAAMYGVAVRNSAQMAVDEINALGGIDGMQFELMAYDDEHKADKAKTTYSAMYESGMQISLGTVTTAPGLEFKELAYEDSVFVLTPSATGDDIVEHENAYQMCFSDSNQGAASAKYFNDNYQGKKVGVFYKSDDEYSYGIYEKFMETLDASFKTAGVVETSFVGDNLTFNTQADMLKDCDVIFLPIYYGPAAALMTAGKNVIKDSAIYFGCDGLDGIDSMQDFDINTVKQEVSYISHFNTTATEGPAYDFVQKYNARYDSSKEPVNQFGAAAYDCVWAIYEALLVAKANGKKFDTTTSASDFCDILTEVFNSDSFVFHGITGETAANQKSNISWESTGFVNKVAVKYIVKESTAE